MQRTYGVVWREDGETLAHGRLEFGPRGVRLDGVHGDLRAVREIAYADLTRVRVGRAGSDRIEGRPSLVIETRRGAPVVVAGVAEPGVVGELAELLGARQLGNVGRRVAVVVPILPGAYGAVRKLLADGPPFEPWSVGLERHEVFLTADEAVFVFDAAPGPAAQESLLARPELWQRATAWQAYVAGPPRLASEAYAWDQNEVDSSLFPPGPRR